MPSTFGGWVWWFGTAVVLKIILDIVSAWIRPKMSASWTAWTTTAKQNRLDVLVREYRQIRLLKALYHDDGMLLMFRKLMFIFGTLVLLIGLVGILVVYLSPLALTEPKNIRLSIDSTLIMVIQLVAIEVLIGHVREIDRLLNFRDYEANVVKRIWELGGDAPTLMAESPK